MATMTDVYKYLLSIGEINTMPRNRNRPERHEHNCEIMEHRLTDAIAETWAENGFKKFWFVSDEEGNCVAFNRYGVGMSRISIDISVK